MVFMTSMCESFYFSRASAKCNSVSDMTRLAYHTIFCETSRCCGSDWRNLFLVLWSDLSGQTLAVSEWSSNRNRLFRQKIILLEYFWALKASRAVKIAKTFAEPGFHSEWTTSIFGTTTVVQIPAVIYSVSLEMTAVKKLGGSQCSYS